MSEESGFGFDAGKKTKGRKRFIVTDTLGLLLAVHVVATSVQDRDGAKRPLLWTRLDHPTVQKVFADQGFAGRLVNWAEEILDRTVEIVRIQGPGPDALSYVEQNRKGVRQPWESSGTFLGLPTPSTGMSVKQPKEPRSANKDPSSWQVTALAGLFRYTTPEEMTAFHDPGSTVDGHTAGWNLRCDLRGWA